MEILKNIDLLSVGIAIAAIGILGFVVFFNNRKSITNQTFLAFSLITVIYSIFNYLNYQVSAPVFILWLIRLTIFSAVWHAFSFFQLFYVFPNEKTVFLKTYTRVLLPLIFLASIFTLTPLVFSQIEVASFGEVSRPVSGPGIVFFGLVVVSLIAGGIFVLIKKTFSAVKTERKQLLLILIGVVITFSLLIAFNFVFPIFFNNTRFIPLAPVFIFPFIFFTAYAILKYRLLNIKLIASEILIFLLVISTFFEVLASKGTGEIVFRIGVFVVSLVFSIFLIRSVRKEVEQRERLQELTAELATANEALKVLDRAKSEFISLASHQLRAPLTVIKGFVSLALEGSLGLIPDKARDGLQKVMFSATQLVKLVNDLLDLSRIESGRIRYDFKPTDFVALVTRVMEEFRQNAEKKGLKISLRNNADELPPILIDIDKIIEVVTNLVDNAIKYSTAGEVVLTLERVKEEEGERVRLSVHDTGLGIKPEDISRLFTKFTRTEDARKIDPNGTGIGLYYAHHVTEAHYGTIRVESEGLGKGSTFSVELPMKGE